MATHGWRIKAAYLEKGWTYKQLAEHYKLSERTIRTRASKEGWRKDRDKIETEARQTIHARAVRGRVEQLEKLITANEAVIDGLLALAELVKAKPEVLLIDDHQTLRNAESMTKAIQTATMTQRDLHKLPTLDQDMRRKEEAQRKREAKAKMELDREKWALVKQEKANEQAGANGAKWKIELPDELTKEGGEIDV